MCTKKLFLTLLFVGVSVVSFSQNNEDKKYPTFKFDGTLKNKFEYVPQTKTFRFDVRNSRLGIKGNIFEKVDYRAQVELSNEGKFQVLDLSGTVRPISGLAFTFGQTSVPIFNSYTTNPGTMMFANRTFLAKYYAGSRDIGLRADYGFSIGSVPVAVNAGIFNGHVTNDPEWRKKLSYAVRLEVGDVKKGLRSTVKIYSYPQSDSKNYLFYGADIRYEADNWKIETEIMKRDDRLKDNDLLSAYIQGAYSFAIGNKLFRSIIPALRYDFIDDLKHGSSIDVHRITAGVGFALSKKPFNSLIRLDYEWYGVNTPLDFIQKYDEMDKDKITLELVIMF